MQIIARRGGRLLSPKVRESLYLVILGRHDVYQDAKQWQDSHVKFSIAKFGQIQSQWKILIQEIECELK